MNATAVRPNVAKKKPGPKPTSKRNDVSAKIDAEVMRIARNVATVKQQTIAEYLSEVVGKVARAEWEKIKNSKD